MNRSEWGKPTSTTEANARAAGRRKYNAERGRQRDLRLAKIQEIMDREYTESTLCVREHGLYAALARHLGVSRSTVCRDMRALLTVDGDRWSYRSDRPYDPVAIRVALMRLGKPLIFPKQDNQDT